LDPDVDEEEWKKDVAEHQRKKAKMNPQSEEDNRRQEPQYQQEVQDVPGSGSETNPLNVAPPAPAAAQSSKAAGKDRLFLKGGTLRGAS